MKQSKQFFYQLYSNYSRKFAQSPSHQVLLKLSRQTHSKLFKASALFSKTIQGVFQFSEIQGLFKPGLELKADAGTFALHM